MSTTEEPYWRLEKAPSYTGEYSYGVLGGNTTVTIPPTPNYVITDNTTSNASGVQWTSLDHNQWYATTVTGTSSGTSTIWHDLQPQPVSPSFDTTYSIKYVFQGISDAVIKLGATLGGFPYKPCPGELMRDMVRFRHSEKISRLRASRLLKQWLSEAEWNYLQERNEIELPSQYEKDVIYIVKRKSYEKVVKKVKGIEIEQLCIMPLDRDFPEDDTLLSKILLIKGNEKQFLKIANRYPLVRR